MRRITIKTKEELPSSLRRKLVFGDAEQIQALEQTTIKIPETLPILKKHYEMEKKTR